MNNTTNVIINHQINNYYRNATDKKVQVFMRKPYLHTGKIVFIPQYCVILYFCSKYIQKMENMEITCHNCGKNVSADTPKCVFCGTVIVVVSDIHLAEQEVNRVIVPKILSLDAVEGRASIKHKIRLQKGSLLEEKPIIQEKKEIIAPKQEEVKPVMNEPLVVDDATVIKPNPIEKKENPIVSPIKEDIDVKVMNNPFDISELMKGEKEKVEHLDAFLNEKKEEPPLIVEKEIYSVSDALKEIMAEEQKLKAFLEEKPIAKEPIFTEKQKGISLSEPLISPEKKEEMPLIFPEKKEIINPPKTEIPDFSPVGIEKIPHNVAEKQGKIAVAWLIRHTENRKPVYYELFEGDNTIGRADKTTPIEVDIADDKYVSRGHAWIRAFRTFGNAYIFELRDDGAKRKDNSPSMNGTYLNASMRRIDSNVAMYLQDGDTIQVGMTKLVFKVKPQREVNQNALFTDVLKSDYTITVFF